MNSSRIALVLAGVLVVAGVGLAAQEAWKRQYIGKSAFSVVLPGSLESAGETKVEDKEDWVVKTDDYTFENDDVFVLITVFHGKAGTLASDRHLATVAKDLVTGISEGEDAVKELGRKVGKLDEKPTVLQSHLLGSGDTASLFKSFLLGDGNKVYAVMAVGYPNDPKSVAAVDRVLGSVRYKMGVQ